MNPKAKKSIFLGYSIGVKGYRLFDTESLRVFQSRYAVFNESASTSEQEKELEINLVWQLNVKTSAVMMMMMMMI